MNARIFNKDKRRVFKLKFFILLNSLLTLFSSTYTQNIETPKISHQSGFYASDIEISITHTENVQILYTLDGSEPKIENLSGQEWFYKKQYPTTPNDDFGDLFQAKSHTYKYQNSILITNRSDSTDFYANISTSIYNNTNWNNKIEKENYNNFKGTCLKAVAYKNGEYSEIITRNFFITPEEHLRYSLPVICITCDPQSLYDYNSGILVPGKLFDDWRINNPDVPHNMYYAPANYRESGIETEIGANFDYIENGVSIINQNIGLRIHGNSSRVFPNKSLRLYARSEYGNSYLENVFLKNYSIKRFKRLILRNHGNDNEQGLIRDRYLQKACENINVTTQEQTPVIVFINGEYNGLYDLIERYDINYFNYIYGIVEGQIDYLSSSEVFEGDSLSFKELHNFLVESDLSIAENYEKLCKLIDIKNYTDYHIAQIYSGNLDWPRYNTNFWRLKVAYSPDLPYAYDGRWRWIFKDLDMIFGLRWLSHEMNGIEHQFDYLERVLNFDNFHVFNTINILKKLLKNKEYLNYFINRYCDLLNTSFHENVMTNLLHQIKSEIEPEVEEFANRWNPTNIPTHEQDPLPVFPVYSFERWNEMISKINNFVQNRPEWARKELSEHLNAGLINEITLDISDENHGFIKINTIEINKNKEDSSTVFPWSGKYFSNMPIQIEAIPKKGYKFSHWSGDLNETDEILKICLTNNSYIKANFILK
ncbi:MAG: hypothetical protein GX879_02160 [Bacteroidales bacterium]|nr:hypothetical protein [Bacteroidales bacterium]